MGGSLQKAAAIEGRQDQAPERIQGFGLLLSGLDGQPLPQVSKASPEGIRENLFQFIDRILDQGFKIIGTDHKLSLVTFRSSLPSVPLYSEV